MAECAHIACNCVVEKEGDTCADVCRSSFDLAQDGGPTEPHCRCDHEGCHADLASDDPGVEELGPGDADA